MQTTASRLFQVLGEGLGIAIRIAQPGNAAFGWILRDAHENGVRLANGWRFGRRCRGCKLHRACREAVIACLYLSIGALMLLDPAFVPGVMKLEA